MIKGLIKGLLFFHHESFPSFIILLFFTVRVFLRRVHVARPAALPRVRKQALPSESPAKRYRGATDATPGGPGRLLAPPLPGVNYYTLEPTVTTWAAHRRHNSVLHVSL